MSKRKYGKCLWCGGTIEITNPAFGKDGKGYEKELCSNCAQYPDETTMIREEAKHRKEEK